MWCACTGNDLQRRLNEAEAQLREEAKLIERLTNENQSKTAQIQSMEIVMTSEMEKHEALMQMLKDKGLTQTQASEHTIEVCAYMHIHAYIYIYILVFLWSSSSFLHV